jgi:hypothetical protein
VALFPLHASPTVRTSRSRGVGQTARARRRMVDMPTA